MQLQPGCQRGCNSRGPCCTACEILVCTGIVNAEACACRAQPAGACEIACAAARSAPTKTLRSIGAQLRPAAALLESVGVSAMHQRPAAVAGSCFAVVPHPIYHHKCAAALVSRATRIRWCKPALLLQQAVAAGVLHLPKQECMGCNFVGAGAAANRRQQPWQPGPGHSLGSQRRKAQWLQHLVAHSPQVTCVLHSSSHAACKPPLTRSDDWSAPPLLLQTYDRLVAPGRAPCSPLASTRRCSHHLCVEECQRSGRGGAMACKLLDRAGCSPTGASAARGEGGRMQVQAP
jgi:hypothetical protein